MAYINFKEETAKGKLQLAKRKTNNSTIIEKLKEHKESLKIKYDSKYSFRKIEGRIINNSKTLKEDEFIEIVRKKLDTIDKDTVLVGDVWDDASNKISYSKRRRYIFIYSFVRFT